jgi:hypothetical protein
LVSSKLAISLREAVHVVDLPRTDVAGAKQVYRVVLLGYSLQNLMNLMLFYLSNSKN